MMYQSNIKVILKKYQTGIEKVPNWNLNLKEKL
jgi:hypothetical protein